MDAAFVVLRCCDFAGDVITTTWTQARADLVVEGLPVRVARVCRSVSIFRRRLRSSVLIRGLLPDVVAAQEAFDDHVDAPLLAGEAEDVAGAVSKRVREFATARRCAREALVMLGVPAIPIRRGVRGAPRWPHGIVGSMTHCQGYRAAAVAGTKDVLTIGIDAEPHAPLPDGVAPVVASEQERRELALLPDQTARCWDRLLFCAKESTYKAWFPVTGSWLGFRDARVVIDPTNGTFTSEVLVPVRGAGARRLSLLEGRWVMDQGLVITTVVVPA